MQESNQTQRLFLSHLLAGLTRENKYIYITKTTKLMFCTNHIHKKKDIPRTDSRAPSRTRLSN